MWQPDGWGFRARIGVVVPHADVGPESEFRAMAPEGVSIHASRAYFGAMARDVRLDSHIALEPVRAFSQPPHVDDAAALLAAAPVDVIVYAFTSSSYVAGGDDDRALAERLKAATGLPIVVPCQAALLGLRALGAFRLAILNPPWFSDELTSLGAEYFTCQGFDVVHASSIDVPGGQLEVHPGELYRWAKRAVPEAADAVWFGGNGLRAVGVIDALERDLGRPVLTANQVALWHALRICGINDALRGYGRIFERELPAASKRRTAETADRPALPRA